jgi:hypothetical protein
MAPRLAEISYSPDEGLTLRFRPKGMALLPEATRSHLRAANKELLLALRGVIDRAIEHTERREGETRQHRRVQVRVGDAGEEKPEDS